MNEENSELKADAAQTRHVHEAGAGVAGAVAGAAMGAIAGPPGMVAGAVLGGIVGAVAVGVVEREGEERDTVEINLEEDEIKD
ncbi:hypothetical protein BH09MYX1_BH09MYX1_67620 [soil metagenome]